MMRKIEKKKSKLAVGTATIVLVGAGAAFAYWTAGGEGTGTAASGDTIALEVVQSSTITNLRPGGSAQTLSGKFNNTNTGPIYVGTVTASIASVTQDPAAVGSCGVSDYTLANESMTVGTEVPVGNLVGSWSGATIQFNNKPAVNQDGCKNATVNLAYTIS
jgi:hypothetical protein